MNYRVRYISNKNTVTSTVINAANKFHLIELVHNTITDIKDDNSDNIISVTPEK